MAFLLGSRPDANGAEEGLNSNGSTTVLGLWVDICSGGCYWGGCGLWIGHQVKLSSVWVIDNNWYSSDLSGLLRQ